MIRSNWPLVPRRFRRGTTERMKPSKMLFILTLTGALVGAACSSDQTMGPSVEPSFSSGPIIPTLARCSRMPYDSVTRTIGPAGGTITTSRQTFVIPANALTMNTTITMVQPADSISAARFYPEGLQFTGGAPTLTLDYGGCLQGLLAAPVVVYVNDSGSITEVLLSVPLLLQHKVQAQIHHFSKYAVAW
jgi:hypothetical protein